MRIYAKFVDSTSSGNPGHPMIAMVRTLDEKTRTAKITKIVVNKVDRCTVVFFDDGKSENVKCSPEDEFDPYVGVAIAKARHEYGSTGAFHRAVDAVSLVVEPKAKKVKSGPIAPGQEPVRRPRKLRTTNKKGSK